MCDHMCDHTTRVFLWCELPARVTMHDAPVPHTMGCRAYMPCSFLIPREIECVCRYPIPARVCMCVYVCILADQFFSDGAWGSPPLKIRFGGLGTQLLWGGCHTLAHVSVAVLLLLLLELGWEMCIRHEQLGQEGLHSLFRCAHTQTRTQTHRHTQRGGDVYTTRTAGTGGVT